MLTENYEAIQSRELEWWTNSKHDHYFEWAQYDRRFIEHLPLAAVKCAIDVGSGPVPYLCNHNVPYEVGIAVDPLIEEYAALERYERYLTKDFRRVKDIHNIEESIGDLVICQNTLDHVQDPNEMVEQLARITQPGGKLIFCVDVNKPPDRMHPHTLSSVDVLRWLGKHFSPIMVDIQKSFKFDNRVLWYVGERR